MEYELARELLHTVLRQKLVKVQRDASSRGQFNQDMQFGGIANEVEGLARKNGHLDKTVSLSPQETGLVRQELWRLIIGGVLVPGHGDGGSSWPYVSFSEYGEKVILQQEFSPYDPTGYVAQLKVEISNLDSIVLFYLQEALSAFRANLFVASTVMLGVASERLLDMLLGAFTGALASSIERSQFNEKTMGRQLSQRYEELRKRIDPKRSQLPLDMGDNLVTYLGGVFTIIRLFRNDSGHPTGRTIQRDEAYANLYVFARYCKYMSQLVEHLRANPGTL